MSHTTRDRDGRKDGGSRRVVRGVVGGVGRGAGPAVARGARPAVEGDRRAALALLLRILVGWALATAMLSLFPGIDRWAVSSTVASVAWALRLMALAPAIDG